MKFQFSPYALIASVVCGGIALLSACGGTATPPSNGANAKTVNTANSNAATNPNSNSTVATVSDKPPITTNYQQPPTLLRLDGCHRVSGADDHRIRLHQSC